MAEFNSCANEVSKRQERNVRVCQSDLHTVERARACVMQIWLRQRLLYRQLDQSGDGAGRFAWQTSALRRQTVFPPAWLISFPQAAKSNYLLYPPAFFSRPTGVGDRPAGWIIISQDARSLCLSRALSRETISILPMRLELANGELRGHIRQPQPSLLVHELTIS